MKVCVAQTQPITGDIARNIQGHEELIDLASSNGADIIIFPELSLTGYEPELAKELAISQEDSRLDTFQRISDAKQITIGVGVPTKHPTGICISLVLFQPHQARQLYSKQYLHPDEEAYFVGGQNSICLIGNQRNVALAICYEISVDEHSKQAARGGAEIYIASVAKFVSGIDRALSRLSDIASQYSMMVLMANCIGKADGSQCAGKTSIWNAQGCLIGQLDDAAEGILILDTETQELIKAERMCCHRVCFSGSLGETC
jgi:predicted amidohydrolase